MSDLATLRAEITAVLQRDSERKTEAARAALPPPRYETILRVWMQGVVDRGGPDCSDGLSCDLVDFIAGWTACSIGFQLSDAVADNPAFRGGFAACQRHQPKPQRGAT